MGRAGSLERTGATGVLRQLVSHGRDLSHSQTKSIELPAETANPTLENKVKDNMTQVPINFQPAMYVNQQLPAQVGRHVSQMMNDDGNLGRQAKSIQKYRRLEEYQGQKQFGKPVDSRGAPTSKRIFVRSDFLGSEYLNLMKHAQHNIADMPPSLSRQMPIAEKEESLYPLNDASMRLQYYNQRNSAALLSRREDLQARKLDGSRPTENSSQAQLQPLSNPLDFQKQIL